MAMKLTLLSGEAGLVRVACEGQIHSIRYGSDDPLEKLLGTEGYGARVLMNLEKAEYIDSSGIGWLLTHHKHFLQAGGKLVLHSVPPRIQDVFNLLRMSAVLHIAPDEAGARALAQGGQS
jgi:anti-sigma B factor antagonist